MTIYIAKALKDNYIYFLEKNKDVIVVDPSEAKVVIDFFHKHPDKSCKAILITHHHSDHIGGVKELVNVFHPKIYASDFLYDFPVDKVMKEGEDVEIASIVIKTMNTPGHTLDHLVYYIPSFESLFSGDTLFGAGCGRIFEGTTKQMYESFQKLKKLPLKTYVYFGHEYTAANLKFAKTVDPLNKALDQRLKNVEKQNMTTPSTLKLELETNPYFRVSESSIKKHLDMEESSDEEVFSKIRKLKDGF